MRMRWGNNPGELNCRTVGRLLHAYLDGELETRETGLVADHLEQCLECGLDAASYRWLKDRLVDLTTDDDPPLLARLRVFADKLINDPV